MFAKARNSWVKIVLLRSVPYYNLSKPKAVPPNQSILPPAIKYPRLPSLFLPQDVGGQSASSSLQSTTKFILVNEGETWSLSPKTPFTILGVIPLEVPEERRSCAVFL